MAFVRIITELIVGIAWPTVFLVFILLFRGGISKLFNDLFHRTEKVSGFGLEASFRQEVEQVTESISAFKQSEDVSEEIYAFQMSPGEEAKDREYWNAFNTTGARLSELDIILSELSAFKENPVDALSKLIEASKIRYSELKLDNEPLMLFVLDKIEEFAIVRDEEPFNVLKANVLSSAEALEKARHRYVTFSFQDGIEQAEKILVELKNGEESVHEREYVLHSGVRIIPYLRYLVRGGEYTKAGIDAIERSLAGLLLMLEEAEQAGKIKKDDKNPISG